MRWQGAHHYQEGEAPMKPKASATAKLHDITEARGRARAKKGGRPSGRGYDPATGKEVLGETYRTTATRESTAESDVFTLVDESGYREDRFYTRSLNADGHGEKLNVRVPQGLDSQIHAAVSEIPEYRSMHDFFRDAAVHRLEYLQKRYNLGDEARRTLEMERIQADLNRGMVETEVMSQAVEDLEVQLKALDDKGDYGMMAIVLDRGGEMVDWLREPYKGRALVTVRKWRVKAKDDIRAALEELIED